MKFLKNILIISFFLFVVVTLPVFSVTNISFDGFIADEAFLLSQETKTFINHFLYDLQQKTGADIAIVTLPTLGGDPIEKTSLNIAREYRFGNADNGLLMLVAPYEKQLRLESGYKLEAILPDGKLGRIRDEDILPYFKQNDFEKGILRGSYILAATIANAYGTTISTNTSIIPEQKTNSENIFWDFLFFLFLLFMLRKGFIIIPFGLPLGSSRAFGGFGGSGGFGGGGVSGRW